MSTPPASRAEDIPVAPKNRCWKPAMCRAVALLRPAERSELASRGLDPKASYLCRECWHDLQEGA
jgi:hypothetical protein